MELLIAYLAVGTVYLLTEPILVAIGKYSLNDTDNIELHVN